MSAEWHLISEVPPKFPGIFGKHVRKGFAARTYFDSEEFDVKMNFTHWCELNPPPPPPPHDDKALLEAWNECYALCVVSQTGFNDFKAGFNAAKRSSDLDKKS